MLWRLCVAKLGVAALGAAMMLGPSYANASQATGMLNVTSIITVSCTISSPTLDFGGYNPVTTNAASPLDSSTSITVNCTQDGSVTLGFDLGANAQGSHCGASPQRCMANGNNYLSYNLYASANDRTSGTVWQSPVAETVSGGTATVNLYGRVPGGQDAAVGTYTDSVTATVYY